VREYLEEIGRRSPGEAQNYYYSILSREMMMNTDIAIDCEIMISRCGVARGEPFVRKLQAAIEAASPCPIAAFKFKDKRGIQSDAETH
jgi:hypothetical protein